MASRQSREVVRRGSVGGKHSTPVALNVTLIGSALANERAGEAFVPLYIAMVMAST